MSFIVCQLCLIQPFIKTKSDTIFFLTGWQRLKTHIWVWQRGREWEFSLEMTLKAVILFLECNLVAIIAFSMQIYTAPQCTHAWLASRLTETLATAQREPNQHIRTAAEGRASEHTTRIQILTRPLLLRSLVTTSQCLTCEVGIRGITCFVHARSVFNTVCEALKTLSGGRGQ